MELHFSFHALERMQERGISEVDIRFVLERPDLEYPDRERGKTVAVRSLNGNGLKIVYMKLAPDTYLVISAWKIEKT